MQMKFGLLADWAGETREGKLVLGGEFDAVVAGSVPVTHASVYLVARFHANVTEGTEHELDIRLIDPSGNRIQHLKNLPFRFVPGGPGRPLRGQVIVQIAPLQLPEKGKYHFEIRVDGKLFDTVPFDVILPPQKG